jgi:hypothetical protein
MAYQPSADDYRAEAEKVLQRAVGLTPADPKFSALNQAQVATCVRAAGHPRRADQAAGGRQLMILKRMTGPRRACHDAVGILLQHVVVVTAPWLSRSAH